LGHLKKFEWVKGVQVDRLRVTEVSRHREWDDGRKIATKMRVSILTVFLYFKSSRCLHWLHSKSQLDNEQAISCFAKLSAAGFIEHNAAHLSASIPIRTAMKKSEIFEEDPYSLLGKEDPCLIE